ncbi:unnamed protein product [Camellia sinensis]
MVMMKKMIRVWILFFVVALLVLVCGEAVTTEKKCGDDFTKVTTCMAFATGKSDTPTKECCTSVTEIKQSDPECLCYFIQQTHSGSQSVKSLGIQESRLLLLPSACKLTNASVSDCPKSISVTTRHSGDRDVSMVLCIIYGHDEGQAVVVVGDVYLLQPVAVMLGKLLNIPSTSPDYAIFTNSSSTTSPSTVTGTSSPSTANDSSGTIRTEHVPQLIGLVTIAMAIFLLLSPVEDYDYESISCDSSFYISGDYDYEFPHNPSPAGSA